MSLRVSKPQCKICVTIGRDANHYTKHNGVVVCPVIKNNICSKCCKKGHFADHCNKTSDKPRQKPIGGVHQPKPKLFFDLLEEEEDEENEEEEEKPILKKRPEVKLAPWAIGKTVTQKKSSWAYDSDEE